MRHLGHVSHNPHKTPPIPPVGGGGSTGFNFVKSDFESGSFAPQFFNPWGFGISVKNDPTARATGKVLDIAYENDPTHGNFDSNLALAPAPLGDLQIGLGQEIDFKGDFYIDRVFDGAPIVQRKLTYWGWSGDTWGFQHPFSLVITSFDNQIAISQSVMRADGNLVSSFDALGDLGHLHYVDTGLFSLTAQTWHTIKVQLIINSSFASTDGTLVVKIDGVTLLNDTNMFYTGADWTEDPNTYKWVSWGFGYQMDSNTHVAEHRYWDNVSFASQDAAL